MKKLFSLFLVVVMLLTSGLVVFAEKPDNLTKPYTNYNNDVAYEAQKANYSVSINYVKNKGFNACVSFPAPDGTTLEDIENEYVHEIYPDATLWLHDPINRLWISIPLELNIILDEYDNPVTVEFIANWKDNANINLVIGEVLASHGYVHILSLLELAVGNYVEYNELYPVISKRTQGVIPEQPYVSVP